MSKPEPKPPPPSESHLHTTIATVSVAQICQSAGYKAAQTLALETLTDIATRYLRAIGDSAAASANSGGRSECNLFDIVAALEKLEKPGCLKEVKQFVSWIDKSPFPHPIPKQINETVTWKNVGNGMGFRHIPPWLPEMPAIVVETGEEEHKERMEGCDMPEKRPGKVKFRIGGAPASGGV